MVPKSTNFDQPKLQSYKAAKPASSMAPFTVHLFMFEMKDTCFKVKEMRKQAKNTFFRKHFRGISPWKSSSVFST